MTITLDGDTSTARAFQTVGGVPNECVWVTFKQGITGTGSGVPVVVTVGTITGDATDFRTGYVFMKAYPRSVPAS